MKILAIGDFHGKFPAKLKRIAKDVDLVLSTGDLGGSDKLLKIIFKYWRQGWWEAVGEKKAKKYIMEDYNSGKKIINELNKLETPVWTIAGNWDFDRTSKKERRGKLKLKVIEEIFKKKKNIEFIHKKKKKFGGLDIYGFGGRVVPYIYLSKEGTEEKNKRDKYKKEYKKLTGQMFKKPHKDLDIFVGHYTPYGYFDKVKFPGENPMNGKHVGCKQYLDYIKRYKPKLFICGHMHEYQGKKKLGDTLIVTTGAAKEGKAAIIDYDEKKGKVKSVKFVK